MDIKTAGLLGAVAAAATMVSAHAATRPARDSAPAFQPASYSELLAPVPDAVTQLKAHDATLRDRTANGTVSARDAHGNIIKADEHHHHHHHHHHHNGVGD